MQVVWENEEAGLQAPWSVEDVGEGGSWDSRLGPAWESLECPLQAIRELWSLLGLGTASW